MEKQLTQNQQEVTKTMIGLGHQYRIFLVIVGATLLIAAIMGTWAWLAPPVEITLASSTTKQEWIEAAVKDFNEANHRTTFLRPIVVSSTHVLSGGSMEDIINGIITPTIWSPGDDDWVSQLNDKLKEEGKSPVMSEASCTPIIETPLGIAMWQPMAEALGWPKPIGWSDILELMEDDQGWARYGHPEWGQFTFGHAHARYSNAGKQTIASIVSEFTGKPILTVDDVTDLEVRRKMQAFQQNTFRYSRNSETLLNDIMADEERSFDYLHAVATFEAPMLKVNRDKQNSLEYPLVFIIPKEGTFWSGHPYCILDQADWVGSGQKEAAEIFRDYLLGRDTQEQAIASGLRPLDPTIPLKCPICSEYRTDPTINKTNLRPLSIPDSDVGDELIELFERTKRKSTVMVVLDISGSMNEKGKITAAKPATIEFLERLKDVDKVGVIVFSDTVRSLATSITPTLVSDTRIEVIKNISTTITASGGTALYQAVCEAFDRMDALKTDDQKRNEARLYGIIVLSDGEDSIGRPPEPSTNLPRTDPLDCLPQDIREVTVEGVKIFSIAFGEKADREILKSMAKRTGGRFFDADPDTIRKIYEEISAEQ